MLLYTIKIKCMNIKFLTSMLVGGLALFACTSENVTSNIEEGNTFVGVSINMGSGVKTKALPDDYNKVGEWIGADDINSIAVYIADGTTLSTGQYSKDDFTVSSASGSVVATPKKAIKTTAGAKKVYVLINAPQEVITALATADPAAFETAYKDAALKIATSKLAKAGNNSGEKDVIMMTNAEDCSLNVVDGVDEATALAGTSNAAKVKVQRSVARVVVTSAATSYQVKNSNDVLVGTISDVTYSIAQGENSLYLQQKSDYKSPAYTFIPTDDAAYDAAAGAADKYDYSGLLTPTAVPTLATYVAASVTDYVDFTNKAELAGKFLLENTHKAGSDATTSQYKKGNTAYVLVKATFTPTSMADGTTYTAGADFYLGANGLFYSSKVNAQDPSKGGINGQKVAKYTAGKVLYFAWLNPDDILKPFSSPTLRNHIYHVHIKGFKSIGVNWNPLVPEIPGGPVVNPDPKPTDPDEPENPIDPTDPLTVPETYMSVDITVLPWQVHSYEITLGF
jgi:hypothetical protein